MIDHLEIQTRDVDANAGFYGDAEEGEGTGLNEGDDDHGRSGERGPRVRGGFHGGAHDLGLERDYQEGQGAADQPDPHDHQKDRAGPAA